MKRAFFFTLLTFCFSLFACAQIINTVAGNHVMGFSGDSGQATAAKISVPYQIAFDKYGNYYFCEAGNYILREVNTSNIISTKAGNHALGYGYSGDGGQAIAARMHQPYGVAIDTADNIYVSDYADAIVRKVSKNGIISTYAGNYAHGVGYAGDGGQATNAELNRPTGLACDIAGNLYIADNLNNVVRKVNTSGIITTYAGNGYAAGTGYGGYTGDGGPATAAEFYYAWSIAIDSTGNLFIADYDNNVIRMVSTSGVVNTVAGNGWAHGTGSGGYSGDGGAATAAELNLPNGVTIDNSGNLYISDLGNARVRRVNTLGIITTSAGNGSHGYSGNGGPATAAELYDPSGVATDQSGNLFISDEINNVIRGINEVTTSTNGLIRNNTGLIIFPNPSNGKFTLQVNSKEQRVMCIEVYNVLGEKVYSQFTIHNSRPNGSSGRASFTIDLSSNPSGIYLYRVLNEQGSSVGQGKLIIQK